MACDGALQRFGKGAASGTTLQWPATMGTIAWMLGGKKKKIEPNGSLVGPSVL